MGERMGIFGRLFGGKKGEEAGVDAAKPAPEAEVVEPEPIPEPGDEVEVQLPEGGTFAARLFVPADAAFGVPGVLWLHGDDPAEGGSARAEVAQLLVEHRPCVVLVLDHPRSREECHAALLWLLEHARVYGIAADQLFTGGIGPAADLALELCLFERDEGRVALAYQMPLYPTLGSGWDAGLSDLTRGLGFSGTPAATVITGMGDPSREEVTALVEKMRADGVEVDFHMYRTRLRGTGLATNTSDVRQARDFLLRQFDEAVAEWRAPQPRSLWTDLPTVD